MKKQILKQAALCAALAFGITAIGCASQPQGLLDTSDNALSQLNSVSVKSDSLQPNKAQAAMKDLAPTQSVLNQDAMREMKKQAERDKEDQPKPPETEPSPTKPKLDWDLKVEEAHTGNKIRLLLILPKTATVERDASEDFRLMEENPVQEDKVGYLLELNPTEVPGPKTLKLVVEDNGHHHTLQLKYEVK